MNRVKAHRLLSIGLAAALASVACSGASPAAPTPAPAAGTAPTPAASAIAATAPAAATPTAIPPSPTLAPTLAPTIVPTIPPTPTREVAPTVAPTSTPVSQSAASGAAVGQGDLKPVADAIAAAKSYRMTVASSTTAQGQSGTFVIEVVKPDRVHTKADMGGQTFEMISIGSDNYVKFGNQWTKTPSSGAANPLASTVLLSSDPQQILSQMNAGEKDGTLTKGGTSQVGGVPCQEWAWTPSAAAPSQGGGTMCIGLKDHLPLQFKTNDGKIVATYSDWNAPISIQAPG
jgi:hypothetical protein